ncbi:MAG: methylisocitrate lyase [Proteobacteria bacterium]|nr:methylisocitrate lyase [Pseudomonadota bacterium]
MMDRPGDKLRQAIGDEKPLQLPGVINAYAAILAQSAGFKALYLSGAGVANSKFALPDLGMTSINDVAEEVERITQACSLPLLVDADTGWGSFLNIHLSFKRLACAGAAGAHIEDQQDSKRCGHRPGKHLISTTEMVGRIKAAVDGRTYDSFLVMARTDAYAVEGLKPALERTLAYQSAGADAIFVEALTSLDEYQYFTKHLSIPVLANMTEFSQTPLFTKEQLAKIGISMILYPQSAFRAMSSAALKVYQAIRQEGTQQAVVGLMQSRQDLYHYLNYEKYEQELDAYLQLVEQTHDNN